MSISRRILRFLEENLRVRQIVVQQVSRSSQSKDISLNIPVQVDFFESAVHGKLISYLYLGVQILPDLVLVSMRRSTYPYLLGLVTTTPRE